MTARREHAVDVYDALEAAEVMALVVEMCDLADAPLEELLMRVVGGPGYTLEELRGDLVRLARAMHVGIEL
jgi:hypothetical protein